jgi:hypothetical protein
MNDTIKMIVYTGLMTLSVGIVGFIMKWFFNQAISILKDIRNEIKELSSITKGHEYKLNDLIEQNKHTYETIERHANQIMDLQKLTIQLQDKINNFKQLEKQSRQ